MSAPSPLLSLVIPTRNRREMVVQALESALLPLPFSCEVILSDNASSDHTPELQGQFPNAKYIRRVETIPMAEHWNLCVQEARGQYIKVLCDDDWLLPGALEREVRELEKDPGLSACASSRFEISEGQSPRLKGFSSSRKLMRPPAIYWQMLFSENILGPPSSVTFRKSHFRGFPKQYTYAADWAAWLLLSEQGSVLFLPEPGTNFRLHPSNLTNAAVENGTDFLEVQALRRECLLRLSGFQKLVGTICLNWIYFYRLTRRIARYLARGNPAGLFAFIRKLKKQTYSPLPIV